MGYYGGLGPMVNGVLWAEVVLFAIFVGLRIYTRKEILNAVGGDDYLCILALVKSNIRHLHDIMTDFSKGRSHSLHDIRHHGHILRPGKTIR